MSKKYRNIIEMFDIQKKGKLFLFRAQNLDKAIDFLNSNDEDHPKGCWSFLFEHVFFSLILLRSLKRKDAKIFHGC